MDGARILDDRCCCTSIHDWAAHAQFCGNPTFAIGGVAESPFQGERRASMDDTGADDDETMQGTKAD